MVVEGCVEKCIFLLYVFLGRGSQRVFLVVFGNKLLFVVILDVSLREEIFYVYGLQIIRNGW